jgi:hypothetical protein
VTEALFGTGIEDEAKQREVREAIAEAFDFFGRRAGGGMAVPEWVRCFLNTLCVQFHLRLI